MNFLSGIWAAISGVGSAVAAVFNYKTKTALTPVQKEVQQVRKERDEIDDTIDDIIDGKSSVDELRDGNANKNS